MSFQALSRQKDRASVLANKIYLRLFDQKSQISIPDYKAWLRGQAVSFEDWAGALDPAAFQATQDFRGAFYDDAAAKLKDVPFNMGGGALCHILYFIIRHYRPKTVLETGVAAGYSTQSMFRAAEDSNHPITVYSSDFPYFRQPGAEDYIGHLVDDAHRQNWHLYKDGDQNNLKQILPACGTIDFFHYDSDKRYAARDRTIKAVMPQMATNGLIMVDDIHDNAHFYDFVREYGFENVTVFSHKGGTPAALIQLGEGA